MSKLRLIRKQFFPFTTNHLIILLSLILILSPLCSLACSRETLRKIAHMTDPEDLRTIVTLMKNASLKAQDFGRDVYRNHPGYQEMINVFSFSSSQMRNVPKAIKQHLAEQENTRERGITEVSVDGGKDIFERPDLKNRFFINGYSASQTAGNFGGPGMAMGSFEIRYPDQNLLLNLEKQVKTDKTSRVYLVSFRKPLGLRVPFTLAKEAEPHYSLGAFRANRFEPLRLEITSESFPYFAEKLQTKKNVPTLFWTEDQFLFYVRQDGAIISMRLGPASYWNKDIPLKRLLEHHSSQDKTPHDWKERF